jgi:hypothetical protein
MAHPHMLSYERLFTALCRQGKGKPNTPAQSAGSSNGVLANGAAAANGAPPASPSKEELDAKFALPDRLKEYTGNIFSPSSPLLFHVTSLLAFAPFSHFLSKGRCPV